MARRGGSMPKNPPGGYDPRGGRRPKVAAGAALPATRVLGNAPAAGAQAA